MQLQVVSDGQTFLELIRFKSFEAYSSMLKLVEIQATIWPRWGRLQTERARLTAPDYYDNDVWHRDARRPLASGSSESDSVFKFEGDKPYSLCSRREHSKEYSTFEYSLLDTAEQLVRNWTVTLDYSSWLDSGTFQMRIRARDPPTCVRFLGD